MNEKTIHTGAACCDNCAKSLGACCAQSAVRVVRVGEAAPTPAKYIRVRMPDGMRYILDGRGVRQMAPSMTAMQLLVEAGFDRRLTAPHVPIGTSWNAETWHAMTEHILSRLAWSPIDSAWRLTWMPGASLVRPGAPPRPDLGALVEVLAEKIDWLLMGGSYGPIGRTHGR